jgi:hypothetical protein
MSKESSVKFTRRNFLQALGIAAVSGAAGAVSSLIPLEYSLYNHDPENVSQRLGLSIIGENIPLEIDNKTLSTRVNEGAFLDILHVVSDGEEIQMSDFTRKFPPRVALQVSAPNTYATYADSARVNHPEVEISTNWLSEYYEAQRKSDTKKLRFLETALVHEFWHMRQDATSEIIRFSVGTQMALTTFLPVLAVQYSYNISKEISKNKGEFGRRAFLRMVINTAMQGISWTTVGFVSGEYAKLSEIDAYSKGEQLIDNPNIAKHRGSFVTFTQR